MSSELLNLSELQTALTRFAKERDWDQFRSPKKLAMAMTIEAAEIMDDFSVDDAGGIKQSAG